MFTHNESTYFELIQALTQRCGFSSLMKLSDYHKMLCKYFASYWNFV